MGIQESDGFKAKWQNGDRNYDYRICENPPYRFRLTMTVSGNPLRG